MSKSNYTVLIIDYEPKSIETTRFALEMAGFLVEVAEDGIAGLEAFDRIKPDLVLIEAMLPKKHGFEVCQEIKKSNYGKNVPVVITTGVYRGRKYRTQALHIYGSDEYLEKPVPEEKLVSLCKDFLARCGKTMDAATPEVQPQPTPEKRPAPAMKAARSKSPTADVTEQEIMERLDALMPGESSSDTGAPAEAIEAAASTESPRGPSPAETATPDTRARSEVAAAPAGAIAETAETPAAETPRTHAGAAPVIHGSAAPTPALEPTPVHEDAEAEAPSETEGPHGVERSQVVQFPTKRGKKHRRSKKRRKNDEVEELEAVAVEEEKGAKPVPTVSELESQLEEITEKLANEGPDDDSMIGAPAEETPTETEEAAEVTEEAQAEAQEESVGEEPEVETAFEEIDTNEFGAETEALAEPQTTDGGVDDELRPVEASEIVTDAETARGKSKLVWIVAAIVIVVAAGVAVFFVLRGRTAEAVPVKTQASTPKQTPVSRPRTQAVFPTEPTIVPGGTSDAPQMADPVTSDPKSAPDEVEAPAPIPTERQSPKPEPEKGPPPAAEETANPVAADPTPAKKTPTPAAAKPVASKTPVDKPTVLEPESKPAAIAQEEVENETVRAPPVTIPTEPTPLKASGTADTTPEPAAKPIETETLPPPATSEPMTSEPTPRQQVVTEPEPEPESVRGTQRGDLVEILDLDQQPVAVTRVPPSYPAIARRAGHEGTVVLNLLIDDKGNVEVVELIKGVGRKDMDEAAIHAVTRWKFKPGIKDDVPVRVWKIEKVIFKL